MAAAAAGACRSSGSVGGCSIAVITKIYCQYYLCYYSLNNTVKIISQA